MKAAVAIPVTLGVHTAKILYHILIVVVGNHMHCHSKTVSPGNHCHSNSCLPSLLGRVEHQIISQFD